MKETIGKRITKFRKAKAMTQEDLAGKLGVSSQAVSKWENDASCPDIGLIPQLCKELGITADELLTGKSDEVKLVPATERKSLDELVFRVKVDSPDGDRVRVNLPMTLVKIALEVGADIIPSVSGEAGNTLKNLDMHKIVDLVERGLVGKLVEVESSNGETVEVVIE